MLNARQRTILFQVIRSFVSNGEPVSSANVVNSGAIDVSSATVRNVMGDLEARGLLKQPHTSAGRVPTPIALRLFVDSLLGEQPLGESTLNLEPLGERMALVQGDDFESAARAMGGLLSELVRLTSIVSSPRLGSAHIKDIHISALSEQRVLVILVASDEQVYQQVVRMNRGVDSVQLRGIEAYLSQLSIGLTLEQVRQRVRRELQDLARQADELRRLALEIGASALESAQPMIVVEGKFNVFDWEELTADRARLKHLLEVLEEKEQVLELLEGLDETQRPVVLIGPELDLDLGDDVSLIVCGYGQESEPCGLLGVIGPSRMDYERVVPLVAQTARALSKHVSGKSSK